MANQSVVINGFAKPNGDKVTIPLPVYELMLNCLNFYVQMTGKTRITYEEYDSMTKEKPHVRMNADEYGVHLEPHNDPV